MQRSDFPKTICEAGWQSARRCMCDGPPGLFEWAFGPRNPMKNRALVGQPILAAAAFQAAFSTCARVSPGEPSVVFRPCRHPRRAAPGSRRFPFYERRRESARMLLCGAGCQLLATCGRLAIGLVATLHRYCDCGDAAFVGAADPG